MIENPTLPPGWTSEALSSGQLLIRSDDGLMVTIDFKMRGFRSGLVQQGKMTSERAYTGKRWMRRLIDDAVQWLAAVRKQHEAK